jgi:hypothetical protein
MCANHDRNRKTIATTMAKSVDMWITSPSDIPVHDTQRIGVIMSADLKPKQQTL